MKMIKTIAISHNPTTHTIVVPVKMVRELGIEKDKEIMIVCENKKIVITKLEQ